MNQQGPAYGAKFTNHSTGLVKEKKHLDRDVWSLALDRVRHCYEQFDTVVVSFSGGKDSTALLHVTLEVARELGRLPVRVQFYDEEAIYPETVDYVRRVASWPEIDLRWLCLPVRHRNGCSASSPEWFPWAPEVRDLWCRELPPEGITEMKDFPVDDVDARPSIPEFTARMYDPATYGNVADLLGMRAVESLMRQTGVRKRRGDNFIVADYHGWGYGNVSTASPIYDWGTDDVWRAPTKFGWDYNRAYDVMEMLGLTPHQQRCAPPFGEEPSKKLWTYQRGWPELWDKMSKRVPGAAAAARYGDSVLYGQGAVPPKPDDMPWDTYLLTLVDRHTDEEVRRAVAYRVRLDMMRHFKKTTDPMVFHSAHPVTGLSYHYLAQLAIRADLKGRRPQMYVGEGEKQWAKYRAELAAGGDRRQLARVPASSSNQ